MGQSAVSLGVAGEETMEMTSLTREGGDSETEGCSKVLCHRGGPGEFILDDDEEPH